MSQAELSTEIINNTEALRSILKSQYHASLAMLKETIEQSPDNLWAGTEHVNEFWQIAYHTLFFAHLYIQPNEAAFQPWERHQANVQYPDAIAGPPDPESNLPLLPVPYTRAEVLEYWHLCDGMVDPTVDLLDLYSPESGFWWYKVPKLEHQIINIRHIQHGAAQLADRLRSAADIGISWAGARRNTVPCE